MSQLSVLEQTNVVIDPSVIRVAMKPNQSFEAASYLIERIQSKETKAFMSVDGLRDLLAPIFKKYDRASADKYEQTITSQLGISIRPTSKALSMSAAEFMAINGVDSTLATNMAIAKELQIPLIIDHDPEIVNGWKLDGVEVINLRTVIPSQIDVLGTV